jgi:hypothetical protein
MAPRVSTTKRPTSNLRKLFLESLEDRRVMATLTADIVGSDLVITDTAGVINNLTVSVTGGNLTIADANEQFAAAPAGWTLAGDSKSISILAASFTGHIKVNSGAGNDSLNVVNTGLSNVVDFDGGAGDSDSLAFSGATNVTIGYANAQTYPGEFDGAIAAGGVNRVNFVGLLPVTMTNIAGVLTFDLPVGSDPDVVIASNAGNIVLTGSTFETTTVALAGVTQVIVNGNGGDDNVTVNATYTTTLPALNINTLGGNDTVTVRGVVNNVNTGDGDDFIAILGAQSTVKGNVVGGGDGLGTPPGGVDTLKIDRATNAGFQVTGVGSGTARGILGTFQGIEKLEGGALIDPATGISGDSFVIYSGGMIFTEIKLVGQHSQVQVLEGGTVGTIIGTPFHDVITVRGLVTGPISLGDGQNEFVIEATGIVRGAYTGGANSDNVLVRGKINGRIETLGGSDAVVVGPGGKVGLLATDGLLGDDASVTNIIDTGDGVDTVTIHGLVRGNVYLGAHADTYYSTVLSQIRGKLDLGAGNDTATIAGPVLYGVFGQGGADNISASPVATVAVLIYGGAGNDTLAGGIRNDLIDGGVGNDTITGAGGRDLLFGGSGNDELIGGPGFAIMFGEAGLDRLRGSSGTNTIQIGGNDADELIGGNNFNVQIGGNGPDRLSAAGQLGSLLLGDGTIFDGVVRDADGNVAATGNPAAGFSVSDPTNIANLAALDGIMATWSSFPVPNLANLNSRIATLVGAQLAPGNIVLDGAPDTLIFGVPSAFDAYFQFPGDILQGITAVSAPQKRKIN